MKIKLFLILLLSSLVFAPAARADIEAIRAAMKTAGDVVEKAKQQFQSVQSVKESAEKIISQGKDIKSAVEDKVNDVKNLYEKAEGVVNSVKDGNVADMASGFELGGLKGKTDGSKSDEEVAEAVEETMMRETGSDSVANSKAISKALNEKNGLNMAHMYAKGLVLRQELRDEKDDPQNPENVKEALNLQQKKAIQSIRRENKVINMDATILEYVYTNQVQRFQKDLDNGENNE